MGGFEPPTFPLIRGDALPLSYIGMEDLRGLEPPTFPIINGNALTN